MSETMIILIFSAISFMLMGYLFMDLYKDSGLKYLLELSLGWYASGSVFIVAMFLQGKNLAILQLLNYVSCFLLIKAMYTFTRIRLSDTYKHTKILYLVNIVGFYVVGIMLFKRDMMHAFIFASLMSACILIMFCNCKLRELRRYTIGNLCILIGGLSQIISMVKESHTLWDIWSFVYIISVLMMGVGFILNHYEKMKNELKYVAYYDSLTGDFNRKTFMHKVNVEIEECKKLNKTCAIFRIDVDNFKFVNDTLGHAYGDEFLKSISKKLRQCIGKSDIIARFGGDEFSILQKNVENIEEVEKLGNRILGKFKNPLVVDNYEFDITASIGIVLYSDHASTAEELLKKSDIAMYQAKTQGKNQYKFFQDFMNEELKRRISIQKKLKKAVKNKEFSVYYQPQVDAKTAKVIGMEALVRWIGKDGRMIPPNEFIPIAEDNGLILPISEFVLRTACEKNKKWNSFKNTKLSISVNISVVQLNQKDFVGVVKKVLMETKLEPEYLILEITESILIKSLESNIRKLEELRSMGIKIALDDFGQGYSSLSYIMNLPIDILKIDKCFVDDITESPKKQCIMEAIISLAQKINLNVVAEGVEGKEQYEILKKQNCDKIQGYYFSKPLSPGEAFEKVILEDTISLSNNEIASSKE